MTEPNLKKGQVILVGAGPGDIGLLTLRGKDWLVRADVVIYDHLVNSNMLRFASSAELIYVGKKAGHATVTQNKINELLVNSARAGKIVIPLRGYCRHPYPSAGFFRGEWLSLKPIIERSSKICSTMP